MGAKKDSDSVNGIRRMPCSGKKDITLTIVLYEFSVEIFEDGRDMSSTICPPEEASGFEITVAAEHCRYKKTIL